MYELDNVRLLVTKFADCYRFYKDILGFKVTWGDSSSGYVSFEAGKDKAFAIFDRKAMAEAVGTTVLPTTVQGQDRFALIFKVEEKLDQMVVRLKSQNVDIVNGVQDRPDWGIKTIHLRDPDGNLIEMFSELSKDKWNSDLLDEDIKFK
ncbi:VOC family protein [Salipaludibacillus sp. LMS25]|jgi:catechol 2,3-dioxygenase-like lactoylglutathione lyase family enzyme|uniref:VOC family protein n=1 Tax=Salipaludibacillus sp. LMS25 TaxID=2924031 RepID=UPI0020D0FE87|nr:VOC family protein [Salipaludibacillus sp. LMS25]UTR14013.1 VOC family protein [Salipaludibacillus sp. LMS25]